MSSDASLAIVVLAAGMSRRLGFPKQLCRWKGESLISRAVNAARAVPQAKVCVVLGAEADRCAAELGDVQDLIVIHNPNYALGIGTSIRKAFEELDPIPSEWRGIIFCVCDQFLLDASVLLSLTAEAILREHPVAASYGGTWGTPLYLPLSYAEKLSQLPDDKGVKYLAKREGWEPFFVPFEEGIHDLDHLEDLDRWGIERPSSS